MTIYLEAAEKIARKNEYSCHVVNTLANPSSESCLPLDDVPNKRVLWNYKNALGPYEANALTLPSTLDKEYWWYMPLYGSKKSRYAQKARVFALLLAHQMVLTGDIVL